MTGTLLGSAAVTLGVGLLGYRLSRKGVLLGAAALMFLTGLGFAGFTAFWPLMVVTIAGTLNPSSGDVSVFLPTEQAALAHTVSGPSRTMVFAWYNLVGSLAGAVGALLSALPAAASSRWAVERGRTEDAPRILRGRRRGLVATLRAPGARDRSPARAASWPPPGRARWRAGRAPRLTDQNLSDFWRPENWHLNFLSTMTGGSPYPTVDATTLSALQWTLTVPTDADAGACKANLRISDVSFVSN